MMMTAFEHCRFGRRADSDARPATAALPVLSAALVVVGFLFWSSFERQGVGIVHKAAVAECRSLASWHCRSRLFGS